MDDRDEVLQRLVDRVGVHDTKFIDGGHTSIGGSHDENPIDSSATALGTEDRQQTLDRPAVTGTAHGVYVEVDDQGALQVGESAQVSHHGLEVDVVTWPDTVMTAATLRT